MNRRRFVTLSAAGVGTASIGSLPFSSAQPTVPPEPRPENARHAILVRAGMSRHPDGTEGPAERQQTVVRSIDSEGRLAAFAIPVAPNAAYAGAPLHLHHEQDEWLYILGGEFVAEVGGKRYRLKPGDSLLMPMKVPHRWSNALPQPSGAIHLYTPAGRMDVSWDPHPGDDAPETLTQRKAEFESYGMTLLGDPLTKEQILETI
jgi:mannose-6-phosphate isomerase-like protein (cupin superfamily)